MCRTCELAPVHMDGDKVGDHAGASCGTMWVSPPERTLIRMGMKWQDGRLGCRGPTHLAPYASQLKVNMLKVNKERLQDYHLRACWPAHLVHGAFWFLCLGRDWSCEATGSITRARVPMDSCPSQCRGLCKGDATSTRIPPDELGMPCRAIM